MVNTQVSHIDTLAALNGFLPAVKSGIHDIIGNVCTKYDMPEPVAARVIDYYIRCFDYNIVGGKLARARTVCESLRIIRGSEVSPDLLEAASVLGYAILSENLILCV